MSVFEGISDERVDAAKPIDQTDRLAEEGLYILVLKSTKFGKSNNVKNKTDGWPLFNGEFTVLENTGKVPVGATRSWGMLVDPGTSTSSKNDAERQIGDIKKFVAAIAASDKIRSWQDIKTDHMLKLKERPLMFEGKRFIAEVHPRKTSQRGNDFFPIEFRAYTEEEAERIKRTASLAVRSAPEATRPATASGSASAPTQTPASAPVEDDIW